MAPLRAAGVAAVYTPRTSSSRGFSATSSVWSRSATGSPPPRGRQLGARLRARDVGAAPAAEPARTARPRGGRSARRWWPSWRRRMGAEAPGHIVGVTGPPEAGKSMLLSALARLWRARGRTVAVLAVDPSSKRSGGALLGDRVRIEADPEDRGLFIRSMAAGSGSAGWRRRRARRPTRWPPPSTSSWSRRSGSGSPRPGGRDRRRRSPSSSSPARAMCSSSSRPGSWRCPTCSWSPRPTWGRWPSARCATWAPRCALGDPAPVLAVCSPPTGMDAVAGLGAHRAGLDLLAAHPPAAPARSPFVSEHGEGGLRALGGRRAASAFLAGQDRARDPGAAAGAGSAGSQDLSRPLERV